MWLESDTKKRTSPCVSKRGKSWNTKDFHQKTTYGSLRYKSNFPKSESSVICSWGADNHDRWVNRCSFHLRNILVLHVSMRSVKYQIKISKSSLTLTVGNQHVRRKTSGYPGHFSLEGFLNRHISERLFFC